MAKPETDPTEETAPQPAAGDEPEVSPEEEARIVDRVVERVKTYIQEVVGTGNGGQSAVAEEGGDGSDPSSEPSTPRQVETASEDAVRAAVEKISAEKEHAEAHAKIKENERPPRQFSRLTTTLWGRE